MRCGLSINISIFRWICEDNYINVGVKVNNYRGFMGLKGKLLRPASWGRK